MEKRIGVGLEYTQNDIEVYVNNFIQINLKKIQINPHDKTLMKDLREGLKFADQAKLVSYFN